ncbi:MAG: hypothetical protein WDM80_10460 [Limisphaerales bacterium]
MLDQNSVPADTFAFADRINQLLAEYQRDGEGKISVTQFKTAADANAASADGLRPSISTRATPVILASL